MEITAPCHLTTYSAVNNLQAPCPKNIIKRAAPPCSPPRPRGLMTAEAEYVILHGIDLGGAVVVLGEDASFGGGQGELLAVMVAALVDPVATRALLVTLMHGMKW